MKSTISSYIDILVKLIPEIENGTNEELHELLQQMQSYETSIFQEINTMHRIKAGVVNNMIDEKNAISDVLRSKKEEQKSYFSKIISPLSGIKQSFIEIVTGETKKVDETERLKQRVAEINAIQLNVDTESFAIINITDKMKKFYAQLDEKMMARDFKAAREVAIGRIIMLQRVFKQTTQSQSFLEMLNNECASDNLSRKV